ncbi:MAG: hypothetical protein PF795_10820, partial [Kiritimatiellae bacterium]|nr:hypothetical protein [Kiritimatiellia bacterium]
MKKIVFAILGMIGVVLLLGVVIFFGMASMGPEIFVVSGRQLPERYVDQLRDLGVVEDDETIAFFYSDALMDIKDGLYFVSDKKVVAYSKDWNPPAIAVPLDSVVALSFERDESFWEDSTIWIQTEDGTEFSIPVSSEQGGDKKFYEYLLRNCKNIQ